MFAVQQALGMWLGHDPILVFKTLRDSSERLSHGFGRGETMQRPGKEGTQPGAGGR
jgi:hypothetical protein